LACKPVEKDFICRHAESRTYLFRLALADNGLKYWNEFQDIVKIDSNLSKHFDFEEWGHLFPFANYSSPVDRNFLTEIKYNLHVSFKLGSIKHFKAKFYQFFFQIKGIRLIGNCLCKR
jgi:hypothetical protein